MYHWQQAANGRFDNRCFWVWIFFVPYLICPMRQLQWPSSTHPSLDQKKPLGQGQTSYFSLGLLGSADCSTQGQTPHWTSEPKAPISGEAPSCSTSREAPSCNTSGEAPSYGTSGEAPLCGASEEAPPYGTSRDAPAWGTSGEAFPSSILVRFPSVIDGKEVGMYGRKQPRTSSLSPMALCHLRGRIRRARASSLRPNICRTTVSASKLAGKMRWAAGTVGWVSSVIVIQWRPSWLYCT